jgi:hypothetical protein
MVCFSLPPASMFERTRHWMGSKMSLITSFNMPGLFLIRSALVLILLTVAVAASAQTVYITRTGAKYHRGDCRYLHSSKIETKLADAKLNYTPCSVCKPPTEVRKVKDEDSSAAGSSSGSENGTGAGLRDTRPATSQQCQGLTKTGLRCKRITTNASGKCWQHE